MRRKLIAGNWKTNLTANEARALVAAIRVELDCDAAALARDRDLMIAPAPVLIPAVSQALAGSSIALGAQNMHYQDKGAFTGEVSPLMLKPFGVAYVILGHSERRHLFREPNDSINQKVHAALRHRIEPILCVGETEDERDRGRSVEVVLDQLQQGFEGIEPQDAKRVSLAYEPVWAIGTGRNATPDQAQEVHGAIRAALSGRFGAATALEMRVIYGGSVTPDNVDSLLTRPDIDGALVGGASLKAESFVRIARSQAG